MRVLRRDAGLSVTAEQVYSTLHRSSADSVWLDSGVDAVDGMSFVAAGTPMDVADAFATLRALPRLEEDAAPLGAIGWLGYELRERTTGVPVARAARYPEAGMLWVDRGVTIDHATGVVELVALGRRWTRDLEAWARETIAALRTPVTVEPFVAEPAEARWAHTPERYLEMVQACLAAITEGEAYQLCLTTEAAVDVHPDPLAAYLALRASSPSHHGALLRIGGISLLSASPESFLTISRDGLVRSKPIKGTRPRGATPDSDAAQRVQLLASDKERAENLMIVDLMRNDIARIAEVGTVTVPSLLAVESYRHVHQLVSTVEGRLRPDLDVVDAIEACFPAGSMTGAPKRRATEILDALEGRARGIYSGAFGRLSADGSVDLAMVIRTIVLDGEGATVGTGGGITALSVPQEELEETRLKAAALLRVLGA